MSSRRRELLTLPITLRHAEVAGLFPALHRDPFDPILAAQAEVEEDIDSGYCRRYLRAIQREDIQIITHFVRAQTDYVQSIIITGGGRGIGAAAAKLCGGRGWSVAISYAENAVAAEATVAEVKSAGGKAFAHKGHVAAERT